VVLLPSVICSDLDENMRVGRLVHETAVALGRRTVFIASCALSHKVVRGPELWPSEEMQQMDHRLVELMCRGKADELAAWLPDYARGAVAEMGGRPLAALVGAMQAMAEAGGALGGRQRQRHGLRAAAGGLSGCAKNHRHVGLGGE
jgi:3,4-dihydroxyphenylacetate 2,3-dioxygenase